MSSDANTPSYAFYSTNITSPTHFVLSFPQSVICAFKAIVLQELNHQQKIDHSRYAWKLQLASLILAASFESLGISLKCSGIFQLFVLYHHRRTLAPTPLPLICAVRFQYLQPCRASDQTMPWTRGRTSYCGAPLVEGFIHTGCL